MNEAQLSQLDDCLNCESGLSTWEIGFIENIDNNYRKKELTPKQEDVLQSITDKL